MSELDKDTILMMMEESAWQRFGRVLKGLKAPKDSGEYRFARFETMRFLSSWGVSIRISVLVVVILFTFAVGQAMTKDAAVEVVVLTPETVKLDEIKEEIQQIREDVDVTSDVAYLLSRQAPNGGWNNLLRNPGDRQDISVIAWCVQAIKAAKIAGAGNLTEIEGALHKAVTCLSTVPYTGTGVFNYQVNMMGEGNVVFLYVSCAAVLALQIAGAGKGKVCQGGLKWLWENATPFKDPYLVVTQSSGAGLPSGRCPRGGAPQRQRRTESFCRTYMFLFDI